MYTNVFKGQRKLNAGIAIFFEWRRGVIFEGDRMLMTNPHGKERF